MVNKIVFLFLVAIAPLSVVADTKHASGPAAAVGAAVTVTATVEAIDYTTRHVTLKKEDGAVLELKVGELAHNFDKVKKGDTVIFSYAEAVAVDVQKDIGQPLNESAELSIERAPKGAQPKGIIQGTVTARAKVQDIDYATRHVTLTGPEGKSISLKVGEHVKRLNEVKKGDQVVVQYSEALGISVTSPKKKG